ncbi:T9SS type B sorting domain-containing protein [Flavobacteriaceae bacterium TP-CH-4]|uniref:T9SS type B sorting domain-containing protein n=1 Tax=Pelagihabitans pacificus TaxID=2696054 RepID=A0A967EC27_9FLAO|nr:T9SS type B sorting domain-containing protein [Pelagihabitans pacificus]NHF57843.1 T9SS type B sorting domain-containing protein [Pelagihabitans pacificus]
MLKGMLFTFGLLIGVITQAQECPQLTYPINGATEVPVNPTITWNSVNGIFGYLISLGTTPGGTDILNQRSAGLTNSFTPEVGLPDGIPIYVTISMFLENQQLLVCQVEVFTTVEVTTPPTCTSLSDPPNNATGINVDTAIRWNYAPTATGYRITIGTTVGGSEVIDDFDVGNVLEYRPQEEFPLDQDIYVTIIPYNDIGSASSCTPERFTTGVPTVDCSLNAPLNDIPDIVGICAENLPTVVTNEALASGFRWFQIEADGSETLLSESREVALEDIGRYRSEAYNNVNEFGSTVECSSSKEFRVVFSNPPTINSVQVIRQATGIRITIEASGGGDYEYALDFENGPYQDSPVFENVPDGERMVFVRDKFGCGTAQRTVERELTAKNFPLFFTPNGDGINDFWQFVPLGGSGEINVEKIFIFDRYGVLLAQIDPTSQGWNGNSNGQPLPESDYWYRAISFSNKEIKGHFTLKR